MLDSINNICVRSGAHCVHSWFNQHNIKGSVRASMYLYNNLEDMEELVKTVNNIKKII